MVQGIFLEGEHDLRGTVPSSGDIFGVGVVVCVYRHQVPMKVLLSLDVGQGPGQVSETKVAELWDGKTRRRAGDDAP